MAEEIVRQDIYKLIFQAVIDGLAVIRKVELKGGYLGSYVSFPKMHYFPSGFPYFIKTWWKEQPPIDYKYLLREKENHHIFLNPGANFANIALQDEKLSEFWAIGKYDDSNKNDPDTDWAEHHTRVRVYGCIDKLIDRYIHITGCKRLHHVLFRPIYKEWENSVFQNKLYINFVIPILGIQFSFEKLEVGNGITIERIADDLQLARNEQKSYHTPVDETLIGAATHALVLQNWTMENRALAIRDRTLNDVKFYSPIIEIADYLFASLRLERAPDVGYSQIITMPIDWADSWEANLPPVHVITVRAYPDQLERYGWLKEAMKLDEGICKNVACNFNALKNSTDNRLRLAGKRLNTALLRNNKEDSILDICIGLETLLLADNERDEITHKLSMRAGALSLIDKRLKD